MAYLNQSQRDTAGLLTLGIRVSKASATVPQSTTQTLFTVAGGRVLINLMFGEVTTVIGSVTENIKVNANPTTGTTYIIASNVDCDAAEAGTLLVVEGDGTALIKTGLAGAGPIISGTGKWICPIGTIEMETGASTTGATKWDLWYFPLDDGASVVSA